MTFRTRISARPSRAGSTTAAAIKATIAMQISAEMKRQYINKTKMAKLMETTRAQVDRLLDPNDGGGTI